MFLFLFYSHLRHDLETTMRSGPWRSMMRNSCVNQMREPSGLDGQYDSYLGATMVELRRAVLRPAADGNETGGRPRKCL